ncbi:MAG TPA: DUF4202 domain-containing protein [Bacteroidales bacterium]
MLDDNLYHKATLELEKVHGMDNIREIYNGKEYPSELLYSQRMLQMLEKVNPASLHILKLAAQCQHLKRWNIPRAEYPYNRRGYHEWRRVVMEYQLKETKEILSNVGLSNDDILLVLDALRNQGDKSDPNAQIIVDTACLVFIKWYMEPFAAKHQSEKVTDILKKTMRKMSENGIQLISTLGLPTTSAQMLERALN